MFEVRITALDGHIAQIQDGRHPNKDKSIFLDNLDRLNRPLCFL